MGRAMKVALLGVWHVHAGYHTRTAMKYGTVTGFYEKDDALAREFAREFGLRRFGTREELLASGVDGVMICSATCDHASDAVAAARAKKDIFCEKLLAPTSAECRDIAAAVAENGVRLTMEFEQKCVANRRAVVAAAKSGELGKINFVRFRYCHGAASEDLLPARFYSRAQAGGGVIADHGAHGLYMIREVLGAPETAVTLAGVRCENPSALAKNVDRVEDSAVTVFRFADGAVAVNECSWVERCSDSVFEVRGEKGFVCTYGDGIKKCSEATGAKTVVTEDVGPSLPLPLKQFMTGEHYPGCSVRDGVDLTETVETAYANMI